MKNLFIIAFQLFVIVTVFAQSPQSFQYQAVVRDAGGNPVTDQSVGVQLSILQGSVSGTLVYTETHNSTTNAFGIVTLAAGGGAVQSGNFSLIDWANGPYFLKVEIDPAGGTNYVDMGATQLLSVPYALYASQAGSAAGGLWDSTGVDIYNTNAGKVGVGTNAPPAKFVVQGDSTMADTIPLFEVKDRSGATVFIIYPDSARLYVGDDGSKTNKGAFAVSGRNTAKQLTNDFLWVTPDSTRIYTGDTISGFAAKNITATSKEQYMLLNPLNSFIGHFAGYSNNGISNVFIGNGSGYFNNTGNYNVFMGHNSGYSNTSGVNNVFLGYEAGNSNGSGINNVFIGYNAGYRNFGGVSPLGHYNTFIGSEAGLNNTEGYRNLYIGYLCGKGDAAGSNGGNNVFLGNECGKNISSGTNNVLIGNLAGFSNSTGSSNVIIGYMTGYYNTASQNTFIGNSAGRQNTSGAMNVFIGRYAGYFNETGTLNTAVGNNALWSNVAGEHNSAFGPAALYSTTGNGNTAMGYQSLSGNTSGTYNTAIGYNSFLTGTAYSNSSAVGNEAYINASNQVRIGNSSVTSAWVQVNWSIGSDARIKENVTENIPGIDFICQLRPVSFNYNISKQNEILGLKENAGWDSKYDIEKMVFSGFIAQEVDEAAKKAGYNFSGIDKSGPVMGLKYAEFVVPIVKAIQEQQKTIEEQSAKIDALQKEINEIKKTTLK